MAEVNPLAGKIAEPSMLVNVPRLVTAYFAGKPDPACRRNAWRSAPRGIAAPRSTTPSTRRTSWRSPRRFAITGRRSGIDGPLFIGMDTHALSEPALASALEVFAANGVEVMIDARRRLHADAGHLARHPQLQQGPRAAGWPTAS